MYSVEVKKPLPSGKLIHSLIKQVSGRGQWSENTGTFALFFSAIFRVT